MPGGTEKMVKQLLKSVREFKKDALLTPLFVVLEVVMEVLIPFVMAELIDKGIDAQNMSAIGKYGFILVACAMLALVFGAAAGTYAARASTGFARNLRHDMYYAVQDFSFSNIDKFSTGSIVTRLTTDVTNVQNAFQMCTRIAVRCPVMLIFAFVMAAKINRNMALIFVAVLPVLAIGLGILMKMVGPVFERVVKIYDRLNTGVSAWSRHMSARITRPRSSRTSLNCCTARSPRRRRPSRAICRSCSSACMRACCSSRGSARV